MNNTDNTPENPNLMVVTHVTHHSGYPLKWKFDHISGVFTYQSHGTLDASQITK